MHNEKRILHDSQRWSAQWLNWEEAPKHFLKPNFHQKRSWLLFGGLLPVWSTIAFRIPVKPFHLRCMLGKLISCNKSCSAWSQYWSAEMTQFFSVTMPYHMSHNLSWTNWATKLCLICHIHLTSHQLNTISSSISTTFCRENTSTTSRRQKMLFKSLSSPEVQISTPQE